ncbi:MULTISPECIES: hypothetical protein [Streptosporangium]|uniref:Rossmann-fold nucleotide-binding protein n=1 Tax=Streptosporangium brasiliense TaxID=47480 RepID=A0ABT9RHG8_9ACTN|nr:hypothetical protein [Streptosporangium brasiliense]MDP9868728.1 putative Rossmann-fold nucleotide-binding protein [Streptosporangium brasiliense]
MRALFTRRHRPATERANITFDEATSRVCDIECRAEAAIERARAYAAFPLFR